MCSSSSLSMGRTQALPLPGGRAAHCWHAGKRRRLQQTRSLPSPGTSPAAAAPVETHVVLQFTLRCTSADKDTVTSAIQSMPSSLQAELTDFGLQVDTIRLDSFTAVQVGWRVCC